MSVATYPYRPLTSAGELSGFNEHSAVHEARITPVVVGSVRRLALSRQMRLLVFATIAYNTIEAAVAIATGMAASSTTLISAIEVASGAAVAWQFSGAGPYARERAALRVITVSFSALAAYITIESVRLLVGGQIDQPHVIGVFLAALSLLIMPVLCYAQYHIGRELGSTSAIADSRQTLLCTYLTGALLIGVLLDSLYG